MRGAAVDLGKLPRWLKLYERPTGSFEVICIHCGETFNVRLEYLAKHPAVWDRFVKRHAQHKEGRK